VAHLTLVHDVASRLVAAIQNVFPTLDFDADSVCFGAATHDVGKAIHPEELIGPGKSHEEKGADLLRNFGISEQRARFAATHARWNNSTVQIEDLLVALADNCWKGKRVPDLEEKIINTITDATGKAHWEVFSALDNIVQDLAADADTRLAWQAQFPAA
jgi:hypothetical protein